MDRYVKTTKGVKFTKVNIQLDVLVVDERKKGGRHIDDLIERRDKRLFKEEILLEIKSNPIEIEMPWPLPREDMYRFI